MKYPEFIKSKIFYSLDKSKSETEQLAGLSENLKTLHQLSSRHFDSFEDLIASYLKAGIDIFQMETGIVSEIINDKDYIIKDVISPLDVLEAGSKFELEGTYCREVHKTKKVIGLPHVGEIEEMKGHPVYQNLKLEAYISAPIFVHDVLFGTLNFTSLAPRENGFSEHEHDLISLMANAIGNFILLQNKENSLLQLNERLKKLVG
ncbi:MAG: GAF domain-containing protein, partial [Gammaproteobacteria bacterium]|nr:GAF domain-containing protein [Gammaproteobacteria bacterium]